MKDIDVGILKQVGYLEMETGKGMLMFQEAGPSCAERESVAMGMMFCNNSSKSHAFDAKLRNCKDISEGWAGMLEGKNGIDIGTISEGSMTIKSTTNNCIVGTFDVKINSSQIKGTFEAPKCESITPLQK